MINVEFHAHTIVSKDSLSTPEKILSVCRKRGIDRIVITDHNSIAGAQRVKELDPTRVIIGEEIMTKQGELLAAFVKELIPEGLEPIEAIKLLRQQCAFISVSHPFDHLRNGHWDNNDLLAITPYVDAIEIFNSRCMNPSANKKAMDFAKEHNILGTVGSDAHATFEIGRATITLPEFSDADKLKGSLQKATYQTKLSPPWIHLTSRYAVWYKRFLQSSRNLRLIP